MKQMRMKHRRKPQIQVLENRYALDASAAETEDLDLLDKDCDNPTDTDRSSQAVIYTMALESDEKASVSDENLELEESSDFIRTLSLDPGSEEIELMSQTGILDDEMLSAFSLSDEDAENVEIRALDDTEVVADQMVTLNSANQIISFDVDSNGRISPLDAYLIISAINDFYGDHGLQESAVNELGLEGAFDINRDSVVSSLDVLMVINQINRVEELDWFMADAPEVSGSAGIRIGEELQGQDGSDDTRDMPQGLVAEEDRSQLSDLDESAPDGTSASRLMLPIHSTVVTGTTANGESVVFTLNSDGKVSATGDTSELNLMVDEQGSIWIDHQEIGLSVIQSDGKYDLSQTSKESDWSFVWASDLDSEFAMLA